MMFVIKQTSLIGHILQCLQTQEVHCYFYFYYNNVYVSDIHENPLCGSVNLIYVLSLFGN